MPHTVPVVMTFNLFDPVGRAWLPAEAADIIHQGCQPLSVLTALSNQDSSGLEDLTPIESEWMEDQARCLLEDIPPDIFKVSGLFDPSTCGTVAKILMDYETIPAVVVINPAFLAQLEDQDEDNELTVTGVMHLVAPLAKYVVINGRYIEPWLPSDYSIDEYLESLFENGVQYTVVLGASKDSFAENYICESNGRQYTLPSLPSHLNHVENTDIFSTIFCCQLLHTEDVLQAAKYSLHQVRNMQEKAFSLGMGRAQPKRQVTLPTPKENP
ncbi:bifunctional hydroxymethylpyrimidine kinase/phosphomethylpyrimidine kinase [Brackiella oedipodis]|uniref:bifunctional hydroxymethylpyrimidine kinase/phosphomethylpyrimidine kinase n=1 Tax=Brackiella oedipodis TaxID=124225 RepID=UPI0006842A9E|nr:bifunctional hydroxymethylpyrimidine kinase/phosphomethylpyrimidine kinase [Brackiella oedipodis]